jgi:hypothetical protein
LYTESIAKFHNGNFALYVILKPINPKLREVKMAKMTIAKQISIGKLLVSTIALLLVAVPGFASKPQPPVDPNNPPPVGAILDLNGQAIPHAGYSQYTVTFVAGVANTAITLAIREDPAYIYVEQVSVTDVTAGGGNLLTNGDFSGGVYTSSGNNATPVGWTYANIYGAGAGGQVITSGCGGATTTCWHDGAVGSYDAISQTIPTIIGHTYQLSFYLYDDSGQTTFSDLTSGELEGIDLTAYAQSGLPGTTSTAVPTLSNAGLFLMALLLAAAGLVLLRRGALAR